MVTSIVRVVKSQLSDAELRPERFAKDLNATMLS